MIGDIKHIIVIESLEPAEKQTGKELYNDTIKMQIDFVLPAEKKMTHKFFDAQTKAELIDALKYAIANADYMQSGLLLHLEMHGSPVFAYSAIVFFFSFALKSGSFFSL